MTKKTAHRTIYLHEKQDIYSNLNMKKLIKKVFKILKLTRTDPTLEPYRCAGLKLANKYYETYSLPKRNLLLNPTAALGSNSPKNTTKQILTRKGPTPEPGKRKKSKKDLTWFLDLPTRLAHPGSVGLQFFLAESFSTIYLDLPGKKKSKKVLTWFFWMCHPF
jgi:hypothetical protein